MRVLSLLRYQWLIALLLMVCFSLARGRQLSDPDQMFSPSAAQKFYEIGYEIAHSEEITHQQAKQAMVFLIATTKLDTRANYALPEMVRVVSRYSEEDFSELMLAVLSKYTTKSADLEVVSEGIRYLLEQLDSREERENLLKTLVRNLGKKNAALKSELFTLLGLLSAETADSDSAVRSFMEAYNSNNYNKLAFAKLAELVGEQIAPAIYLEHRRLEFGENLLNIEAAMAFARQAEQLQLYQTAAEAYEYCADLFNYLNPSEALPAWIYLPWTISNYNTQRSQHRCLQIARNVRQSGRFDIILEAIAGKAAAKTGDIEQANRIYATIEEQRDEDAQALAWFYCFVSQDVDSALERANAAYAADTDSSIAAALLAYALVMNGQAELAKNIIENYEHSQISDLAMAQIQLAEGKRDSAIESLKLAINRGPASLEAERAKEILAQEGGEYVPAVDVDVASMALRSSFGSTLVPSFTTPEKMISVQLNVRGNKFSYGREFEGSIAITNNSTEPLVVSDDGLFKGYIRVDAAISGDLNKEIPALVDIRLRPALPVEPGRSLIIPLRLVTGQLRRTLLNYPQASFDIEFSAFIDPVVSQSGQISNRLAGIPTAKLTVSRPGKVLTSSFLQNRLNSLSKGKQGQQIEITRLFAGLLMEQNAMANREPLYKFMYADWMPAMLKAALVHSLRENEDWIAKSYTMSTMLDLPLDYELLDAVSENLNETHWPTRMMALYLLANKQGESFKKVLDWTANYDPSNTVRSMAIALGGEAAAQQETPPEGPTSEELPPGGEK
jgi:hypothetical protein